MSEIGARISITKQIRQYEPIKVEAWASETVQDVHDKEAWQKIWDTIEAQLEDQVKEITMD
jgi:hypothetical protein